MNYLHVFKTIPINQFYIEIEWRHLTLGGNILKGCMNTGLVEHMCRSLFSTIFVSVCMMVLSILAIFMLAVVRVSIKKC